MKTVVIDTNVLISGLLFDGPPGELVTLWKKRIITPYCSREIIEEYLRVLTYPKFNLNESEIDFILTQEILPFFETVKVKPGKRCVRADAADDKFIWCALACKADAIVSGDAHLLNLAGSPVPIFNAVDFLKERANFKTV